MPYEHLDGVDVVRSHCDCERRQPFVRRVDCSVTWRMTSRYVEARERLVDVDVLVKEQQVLGREIVTADYRDNDTVGSCAKVF